MSPLQGHTDGWTTTQAHAHSDGQSLIRIRIANSPDTHGFFLGAGGWTVRGNRSTLGKPIQHGTTCKLHTERLEGIWTMNQKLWGKSANHHKLSPNSMCIMPIQKKTVAKEPSRLHQAFMSVQSWSRTHMRLQWRRMTPNKQKETSSRTSLMKGERTGKRQTAHTYWPACWWRSEDSVLSCRTWARITVLQWPG